MTYSRAEMKFIGPVLALDVFLVMCWLKSPELAKLPKAPTPLRSVNVRLTAIVPFSFHRTI